MMSMSKLDAEHRRVLEHFVRELDILRAEVVRDVRHIMAEQSSDLKTILREAGGHGENL